MTPAPSIAVARMEGDAHGVVEKPLTAFDKIYNLNWLRKLVMLIVLAVIWEVYARWLNNALLFPTFAETVEALVEGAASGILVIRAWASIQMLLAGYVIGIMLAGVLTFLAIGTRIGSDFLETMTSIFNPLPAIALLPLAMTWFGLGSGSLIFVLVHSVLWTVALNTHSGFRAVSSTLRMVGQNCSLSGPRLVCKILIPAALPSILTGLKIGWAFAWRTLIAAELVFGVSSGRGGLGWFIYERKNLLDIPDVFAGLLTVIIIGLAIENLVFRKIEEKTVRRWGMQQ
ncbi:ABC transporter permease [Sinorhizobium mexicanum]|nr:ABC transporter permease [Sinorhizobium mexicanum]